LKRDRYFTGIGKFLVNALNSNESLFTRISGKAKLLINFHDISFIYLKYLEIVCSLTKYSVGRSPLPYGTITKKEN